MFGEKLRLARINAGYTQQQLGEAIGKHKIFICQVETGYCLPTESELTEICKLLKVSPIELDFPQVITQKTRVITDRHRKSSTTTYKLTVPLDRAKFPKLTKSNLKKAGYANLEQFISVAYCQLEKQLINEK